MDTENSTLLSSATHMYLLFHNVISNHICIIIRWCTGHPSYRRLNNVYARQIYSAQRHTDNITQIYLLLIYNHLVWFGAILTYVNTSTDIFVSWNAIIRFYMIGPPRTCHQNRIVNCKFCDTLGDKTESELCIPWFQNDKPAIVILILIKPKCRMELCCRRDKKHVKFAKKLI